MYDAIIIGGGAAGLMAAITASDYGKTVLLFEKNKRVGRKLLITGKGRCNVTNNCTLDTFMENIPCGSKFLFSCYSSFDCMDTMAFFESLGVPLKTERGNRVFPVSDKAEDIVSALEKAIHYRKDNITIKHIKATDIAVENGAVKGVYAGGVLYESNAVMIATGGSSYSKTGSDGFGYTLAKKLGHSISPIRPSLVPLTIKEKFCADIMGLSLKNVTLSLIDNDSNKVIYTELGEMLFTHFGISGPLVLSASGHIREMKSGKYRVAIDLKPGLDEVKLDKRIQRDFAENINKTLENALVRLLPTKLIPYVIIKAGLDCDKRVNQITVKERLSLVQTLKAFTLNVTGFRPIDEAIVTGGGVKTSEINPKTMESKLVKGLYFGGEVIDVDAYTGGFNLQIAFSTGNAAGRNM